MVKRGSWDTREERVRNGCFSLSWEQLLPQGKGAQSVLSPEGCGRAGGGQGRAPRRRSPAHRASGPGSTSFCFLALSK